MAEFLVAERYEWIEVALARYHLVGDNGCKEQDNTRKISPELEDGSQYQVDQPEKLDRITKFVTGMRVISNGNKCHVEHDLGVELSSGFIKLAISLQKLILQGFKRY